MRVKFGGGVQALEKPGKGRLRSGTQPELLESIKYRPMVEWRPELQETGERVGD